MTILIPDVASLHACKRHDWELAQRAYFAEGLQLASMVADYIRGIGKYDDMTRFHIRSRINEMAVRQGRIEEKESMFDGFGCITERYQHDLAPEAPRYSLVPAGVVNSHIVLAESRNWHSALALPPGVNMVAKLSKRPAVKIYSAANGELYLHPFCYQLFWPGENWFCPFASNRSLSKVALSNEVSDAERFKTSRHVVIFRTDFLEATLHISYLIG